MNGAVYPSSLNASGSSRNISLYLANTFFNTSGPNHSMFLATLTIIAAISGPNTFLSFEANIPCVEKLLSLTPSVDWSAKTCRAML